MAYSPVVIANTFLKRHGAEGGIDHLKLQKLTYFAQGWWLALNPTAGPFTNVRPQVWRYGPVFQQIYSSFGFFGDKPIIRVPTTPWGEAKSLPSSHEKVSEQIDWIWQKYGSLDGIYLSDLTHKPGTPWYNIAKQHDFVVPKFLEIPESEDRAYFNRLAKEEGLVG